MICALKKDMIDILMLYIYGRMSLKEVDEQMLNVKLKNNSYFVEWINNIHLLFVHKKDLKW